MTTAQQRKRQCYLLLAIAALFTGTSQADAESPAAFAAAIEAAHKATRYRTQEALACNIEVSFGGKTMLQAEMLMDTPAGRSRLTLTDGSEIIFDGRTAWVTPADATIPMARFHALTWPYFLAAPYKLRDPGSHLASLGPQPMAGGSMPAAKLTFDPGIGDTPEDWYIAYRDPASNRLVVMSYIVTYGTPTDKANEDPHAIRYEQFQEIDGVPISTRWTFWDWSPEGGLGTNQLGTATLTKLRFVRRPADAFAAPPDAREEKLPPP